MRDAFAIPEHLHWTDAAYHWEHYGPPLRPGVEDLRAIETLVAAHAGGPDRKRRTALLLGVTPEIAMMSWPEGTELVAVDKSPLMIERVWPGDAPPRRRAVRADWLTFAATAPRHDWVVGDGTFAILGFPQQQRALARSVHRALAPDGLFVTRLFLQPENVETPEAVFADLVANRVGSFHAFKLRLAMSMQRDAASGVRMGEAYAAWEDAGIDHQALLSATGWPPHALETIRPWAGKDSRLAFPTVAEMATVMGEFFEMRQQVNPDCELGERCPIVAYRPLER